MWQQVRLMREASSSPEVQSASLHPMASGPAGTTRFPSNFPKDNKKGENKQ